MADQKHEEFPQPEGDEDHITGQVLLSLIPGLGGAAAKLFTAIITPPIEKRRADWLNSLAAALKDLERQVEGFTTESLTKNEVFISCLMHASLAAQRNHQEEKINALRNAVLNVACGRAPDEDLQLMFLHMIDSFTPWHIRLLAYFNDPLGFTKARGVTYDREWPAFVKVMRDTFPELKSRMYHEDLPFFLLVRNDLRARGLLSSDSGESYDAYDPKKVRRKTTSELGDSFLSFISCPPQ